MVLLSQRHLALDDTIAAFVSLARHGIARRARISIAGTSLASDKTPRVESSSTDDSRLRGARPPADKEHAIDSTIVQAHHASNPLTFDVTGGKAHEVKGYDALMQLHHVHPDKLLGDKGYDSDDIRSDLADRGIQPVIPPRSNRKTPIEYDRKAYKGRNLIERCVNRLKQFRRIATRNGKTARAYLSMLCIPAAKALDQNCQHGLNEA